MKTYSEKLKDPRWQRKRLEIMQRDQFACQRCGNTEKTLHVHHWKYSGNPWDAENEDLVTFCDDCHSFVEMERRAIKDNTSDPDAYMRLNKFLNNRTGSRASFNLMDGSGIVYLYIEDGVVESLKNLIKRIEAYIEQSSDEN